MKSYSIAVAATLLLLCSGILHAAVQVNISRPVVAAGESLDLVIKATGQKIGEPDFSPLTADFSIANTQRSQVIQISNGKRSQENVWTVTMIPKRTGVLLIPSLQVGAELTRQLQVQVNEAQAGGQAGEDVFVEVSTDPVHPYVQQHVLFTIKLYRAIDVNNATIDEPKPQPSRLRVEKLGDSSYSKQNDGRTYRVNELRYVLIPLQSGAIEVAATNFRGQVRQPRRQVLGPDGKVQVIGGGMTNIARQASAVTLNVRPIPAAFPFGANWLPAKGVRLAGGWVGNVGKGEVGVPLTYGVQLRTEHYLAHQVELPPLEMPPQFRSYEESPSLNNQAGTDGFTGVYVRNTALIPEQPGNYTIPQLELPWWNVATDSLEYARLAAKSIEVAAAPAQTPAPAQMAPPQLGQPDAKPPAREAPSAKQKGQISWWWLSLSALLLVAWLGTLFMWWRERHQRQMQAKRIRAAHRARVGEVRRELESACLAGDVSSVRTWLLRWGQMQFPHDQPHNIGELAYKVPVLQKPLDAMNKCIYQKQPEQWRGRELWQVVMGCPKPPPPPANALEPLHRV